jgi:hypothetical protein
MNEDYSRLQKQTRQSNEEITRQHSGHQSAEQARQFSSVEELIRFDASQTTPPPGLEQRLAQTINAEQQGKSWWKRLFGR